MASIALTSAFIYYGVYFSFRFNTLISIGVLSLNLAIVIALLPLPFTYYVSILAINGLVNSDTTTFTI